MFVKRIFVATAVLAGCALVAVNERSARSPLALLSGDDKPLGYVKLQVPVQSTLNPPPPALPGLSGEGSGVQLWWDWINHQGKGQMFSYGGIGSTIKVFQPQPPTFNAQPSTLNPRTPAPWAPTAPSSARPTARAPASVARRVWGPTRPSWASLTARARAPRPCARRSSPP